MRKLLNVLYVTTPESYLSLDGENIVILVDGSEKFRIPMHNIESIVSFAYLGASPALMGFCAENGVGLCFLSPYGKFLARVSGSVHGNVLLRKQQFIVSEVESECARVAINCITGKLVNSRVVIERGIRDHGETVDVKSLENASEYIKNSILRLQNCKTLDEIRGVEGDCAKTYFGVFDELILQQKSTFFMKGRNKRPPTDNVNAMISFLYTLLAHDIQSALETVGLDPYVGFLHRDRPGRASLALDIMEEFRAFMVDRLVLSMINRKQISAKGFTKKESGGVIMDNDTRKEVLTAWQKRKQEEINHPFLNEKVTIGLLPYIQALLLARYLRGDLDGYPPFLWK
ncbi:MAG TPA: subtype I-C CRISPR-associated endonuclease Cas1 [Clostridiales bacterium]|nr:MAG: subtype I-C CRISPR-associated endonuclease Cas1 [Clostridiales bacterium GWD2_32_19]HCC07116.1 subtype I-C CRISPR-associated endonuclease Cas1 [Clostridiales bacterium]